MNATREGVTMTDIHDTDTTDVATFDFRCGPVPAHRHVNGGGWVADSASVDDGAYIGPDARVSGDAQNEAPK